MTNLIYKMPESLTGVQILAAGDYERKERKVVSTFFIFFCAFFAFIIYSTLECISMENMGSPR